MAAGPTVLKDNAWQEKVFVALAENGGSDVDFQSTLTEIGFGGNEKGAEGQPILNGGRVTQLSAQEDLEFTGTFYPVGTSSADGNGLAEWFMASDDQKDSTSSVYEWVNTLQREDMRVVVLWTNDTNVTSAVDAVGPGTDIQALRYVMTNATLTEVTPSFDDRILTADFTFTIPPFDVSGNSNVTKTSYTGDSSETLESLGTYGGS